MRLLPSDPDVATIVSRIRSGDLDLQPAFQRGEIWSKLKKQRLIDSILRDWHVPPIHVIEDPDSRKQEVLDGQQRLVSIRDFVEGQFPVDGHLEPADGDINALDGKYYHQLPHEWRRHFDQFTIRIFRIKDYNPREPAELFFRLNQPSSLTGAEQRNAFFGPVREQVREIVAQLESKAIPKSILAFSNSRMAYDDVIARTALAIERRTLADKITASDLADLYRSETPLKPQTVHLIADSVDLLAAASRDHTDPSPKFNKATFFSWLIFIVRAVLSGGTLGPKDLSVFLSEFELLRYEIFMNLNESVSPMVVRLLAIYDNRSAARVADVSSVVLRDAAIWYIFAHFRPDQIRERFSSLDIGKLDRSLPSGLFDEDALARNLLSQGWGELQ